MPIELGKPDISHAIPDKNIIEAMHAENNAAISHQQPVQETKQITSPENTNHPTDNSSGKLVDSISLDQLSNSDKTQSQDDSASKSTSINTSKMTLQELTPLLTKYVNKIDGLTNDDIDSLQRLFESSDAQIYRPDYSDPISMGRFNTAKDYVNLLQKTKFRNIPPFMLKKYVDLVLAETKSGQKGWIGVWPILTPADVLNYKPGWPEKDADHDTLISTPSDLQTLYRDMQIIENKQIRVENATKRRAKRIIQDKITDKKSTPAIEIEEVSFTSLQFRFTGIPTESDIKNLMIKEYFHNKKNSVVTVSKVEAGGNNETIYCVLVQNKPVFILKISAKNGTDKNLVDLQKSFVGRIGMQSRYESALSSEVQKNMPIVTWMEKLYTYKDQNNQNRTIEMMHAAKGKSLADILDHDPHSNSILAAFNAAGSALGSFQQFFIHYKNPHDPATWQTVIHGDYHIGNIFFDASKSQIYLIDNETMSPGTLKTNTYDGYDHQEGHDFKCFFLFMSNFFDGAERYRGIRVLRIYDAFIDGYFESFPPDKRSILAQYMKENSGLDSKLFDPYITPSTQAKMAQVNQPTPA